LHGEALAIREASGDRRGLRESLHGLGDASLFSGERGRARDLFERGLAIAEELDDIWGQALFTFHLGLLMAIQHGAAATRAWYERALALARAVGNAWGIAYSGGGLGRAALAAGDVDTADALFRETLHHVREIGDQFSIQIRLSDLGAVAAARGNWERVLRLEGASAALREARGFGTFFVAPADVDARIARARQALPPHVQAAAWADGIAMSLDEAVAYALAPDGTPMTRWPTAPGRALPLSPREHEVAVLIGRGLTNRQIGEALAITEGTARIHVTHVLTKLGFHSRVQVAGWVAERGLLGGPTPGA
jgi:DNA-binding CsgD family transcriptional regulator